MEIIFSDDEIRERAVPDGKKTFLDEIIYASKK
jgi:hypothetical protein